MKKQKSKKSHFNNRDDGRVEWLCEHGIGHTIIGYATHGCDGCCGRIDREALIKEYKTTLKKLPRKTSRTLGPLMIEQLKSLNEHFKQHDSRYDKVIRYIGNNEIKIVEKLLAKGEVTIKLSDILDNE